MSISSRITDTVEGWTTRWGKRLSDWIIHALFEPVRWILDLMEHGLYQRLKPLLDQVEADPDAPANIKETLRQMREDTSLAWLPIIAAAAMLAFVPTLMQYVAKFAPETTASFARLFPGTAFPLEASISAWFRGELADEELGKIMLSLGVRSNEVPPLIASLRRLPTEDALRQLLLRGEIDELTYDAKMAHMGWTAENIAELKKLHALIPGPTDLIRMALREVWHTEFRPGLLIPPPPGEFYAWMSKQGYSSEWADSYWAAHWVLPSVTQAFEMFHRIPEFTEDALRTLLRRQDVLEEYHDNLIAIAYRPYTRVDVRRMYKAGVLDRDGVVRAMLDLGYDSEKAARMAEFYISWALGEDRDLTKSDILSAYKKGEIDEGMARELLADIDYGDDEIDFLLAGAEQAESTRQRDLTVSNLRQLYQLGILDQTSVTARLADLDYGADEIGLLYLLWDVEAPPKVSRPSRADLDRFLKGGIIDEAVYRAEMGNLGYTDRYIAWYLDAVRRAMEEAE